MPPHECWIRADAQAGTSLPKLYRGEGLGRLPHATATYSKLLLRVYEHPAATAIVEAKVLEIKELKSGFQDIRESHLKGSSDWRAWASIVGSTSMPKGNRNQMLKDVGKASRMNSIVAAGVMSD